MTDKEVYYHPELNQLAIHRPYFKWSHKGSWETELCTGEVFLLVQKKRGWKFIGKL